MVSVDIPGTPTLQNCIAKLQLKVLHFPGPSSNPSFSSSMYLFAFPLLDSALCVSGSSGFREKPLIPHMPHLLWSLRTNPGFVRKAWGSGDIFSTLTTATFRSRRFECRCASLTARGTQRSVAHRKLIVSSTVPSAMPDRNSSRQTNQRIDVTLDTSTSNFVISPGADVGGAPRTRQHGREQWSLPELIYAALRVLRCSLAQSPHVFWKLVGR